MQKRKRTQLTNLCGSTPGTNCGTSATHFGSPSDVSCVSKRPAGAQGVTMALQLWHALNCLCAALPGRVAKGIPLAGLKSSPRLPDDVRLAQALHFSFQLLQSLGSAPRDGPQTRHRPPRGSKLTEACASAKPKGLTAPPAQPPLELLQTLVARLNAQLADQQAIMLSANERYEDMVAQVATLQNAVRTPTNIELAGKIATDAETDWHWGPVRR